MRPLGSKCTATSMTTTWGIRWFRTGKWVITVGDRLGHGGIGVYRLDAPNQKRQTMTFENPSFTQFAFTRDGNHLALAQRHMGTGAAISLFDMETGETKSSTKSRYDAASSLAFHPDGKTLFASVHRAPNPTLWLSMLSLSRKSSNWRTRRTTRAATDGIARSRSRPTESGSPRLWAIGSGRYLGRGGRQGAWHAERITERIPIQLPGSLHA